ncbi:unnamed protein product [Spirodela intermedia]|uniref:Uncharacterized protein n=1 Tax=Spirodela intermedia TaxID=51605 RepID=A0A7I8IBD5_SPIIN|nr:unnamed protein product [Spirodela intermedia]CAA6655019.1 unnamed protein product [Spirodela intermedia]
MPREPFPLQGGRLLAAPPPPPAACAVKRRLVCFSERNCGHFSGSEQSSPSPLAAVAYDFVRLISASAKSSSPSAAVAVHSTVVKLGLLSNIFITSALVDSYCKSKRMADAHQFFGEMTSRNVMIAAGVSPSPFTVSSVLLAGSSLGYEATGAMVHYVAVKHGFCSNVVVATSLVDMYSKCSVTMADSRKLFDETCERNLVSWTSLITGYSAHQRLEEAMVSLNKMRLAGVAPNEVTFSGLLSSFTGRDGLDSGRQIHSLAIRQGTEADTYVSAALINMYSRCDSSEDYFKLLDADLSGDQVLQNSIISGFPHLGNLAEAIGQFIRMRRGSMDADFYTFASLLWAAGCSSALEEGKQAHALVIRTGCSSSNYVQNGLVAMYARCGAIDDSKRAFSAICSPDLVSWNSIISGFAWHGHARHALELFQRMRSHGVEPDETTYLSYSLLAPMSGLLTRTSGQAESVVNAFPVEPEPSIYRSLLSACKVHGICRWQRARRGVFLSSVLMIRLAT